MQSSRLDAVRVELLKGVALVDVVELLREHSLTLLVGDAEVSIHKAGLYRLQATPVCIRVFNGQAEVRAGGQAWSLKGGRELFTANGGWVAAKFDQDKGTDALYRWSKRRAGYIAMANVSAARQAGLMSSSFTGGRWFWNPYFGFATYIPWSDAVRSPFGYYYYTPSTVQYVYFPPQRGLTSGVAPDRGTFGGGLPGSLPRRSAAGSTYTPQRARLSHRSRRRNRGRRQRGHTQRWRCWRSRRDWGRCRSGPSGARRPRPMSPVRPRIHLRHGAGQGSGPQATKTSSPSSHVRVTRIDLEAAS